MRRQKILAALLALVMVMTLLPLTALAAETEVVSDGSEIPEPVDHTLDYPNTGTTYGQPFVSNSPSQYYRIPSIITTRDGTLLAACDARWSHTGDAAGLDTIISRSEDGGQTWHYQFANYFNDCQNGKNTYATAFIDPAMIQDPDSGTIYLLVDIWPGGVALNTAQYRPRSNDNGYRNIGGTDRLVLFSSAVPSSQSEGNWTYWVGDFEGDYAPVYEKADEAGTNACYYVDKYYYIYDAEYNPIMCDQLSGYSNTTAGNGTKIYANIFYFKDGYEGEAATVKLHVAATSHLWLVKSDDDGKTWSEPQLLNSMVRVKEQTSDTFYGVGPGRGLVLKNGDKAGRIMFSLYTFNSADRRTSVIYSDDDGATWHKSEEVPSYQTSEGTMVEVGNTIYLFCRHGKTYKSTDNGESWTYDSSLWPTGLCTTCQIDTMVYSKKINGKTAILLSGPKASDRRNGTVFVGLVDDAGGIDWKYTYTYCSGTHSYSCLTELEDGSVSVLHEPSSGIRYVNIPIRTIVPTAVIDGKVDVSVPIYKSTTLTLDGVTSDMQVVNEHEDLFTATAGNGNVVIEGHKTGTASFTVGDIEVTVTVNEDGYVVNDVELKVDGTYETSVSGAVNYEKYGNSVDISTTLDNSASTQATMGEQGGTGSGGAFTGKSISVNDALFTAQKEGDKWVFSASVDGTTVYLQVAARYPTGTSKKSVTIANSSSNNGSFTITDGDEKLVYVNSSLWPIGGTDYESRHFDVASRYNGTTSLISDLYIYTMDNSDGDLQLADIDNLKDGGYYRVTSVDQLKSGGQYIIVAQGTGFLAILKDNVVLYPNYEAADDDFMHYCAKITGVSGGITTNIEVTGKTSGVTDVVVGNVIYRFTVKEDVTAPALSNLPNGLVTVACGNKYDETAAATYDAEDGGVTIAWTPETDTATATVNANYYLNKYNDENTDVTHNLATEQTDIIINLSFADGKWTADTKSVTINVTCDTKPAAPTEDEVKGLLGEDFVTVVCGNENDTQEDGVYGWLDGGVTVGTEVNDSDGDGVYEAEVTLNAEVYLAQYNEDREYDHTFAEGQDANVKLSLTYGDDGWELAEGAIPVTVNVICTYEPSEQQPDPPVVTPPAGGGTTQIPDEEPPLDAEPDDGADIPDDTTPLAPAPEDDGDTDISDTDTPLDSTPKTGDNSIAIAVLWSIFSMSAIGFVWVVTGMRKSGRHSK